MGLIKLNNIRVNYIEKGKEKPFILIHGIFYDSSGYKKLISILSQSFKVYAIDFPMHGRSEKPKKYLSISDFSMILKEFIKKLNIKNPIVCGHSGGALVAMDYASKNKIKGLILLDPPVRYYNSKLWFFFKILVVKTFFDLFWNLTETLKIVRTSLYNIFKNVFNKNYWRLVKENLREAYNFKIDCPTKIFWGRFDEIMPYKFAGSFQENIKNSELIVVEGNHDWPILKPEEIIEYIDHIKFLK